MSGKTAKKLRTLARQYTTNYVSNPFWTERGVEYPEGSYRRTYRKIKRAYKRGLHAS